MSLQGCVYILSQHLIFASAVVSPGGQSKQAQGSCHLPAFNKSGRIPGQPTTLIPRTLVKLKRRNSAARTDKAKASSKPPAGGLPPLKLVANSSLFLGFQGQSHIVRKGSLCSPASGLPQTQSLSPTARSSAVAREALLLLGWSAEREPKGSPFLRYSVSTGLGPPGPGSANSGRSEGGSERNS